MKRHDAIKTILSHLKEDDAGVFTTGMISREAFNIEDRKANFYMLGSMGLASSFSLGLALNTKKKVVVFDGDGSALMETGSMAMIGYSHPYNLIHIVLDNECYQSTGFQPTITRDLSLDAVARVLGYKEAYKVMTLTQLKKKMKICLHKKGPVFILVKVDKSGVAGIGRVAIKPEDIKRRFQKALFKT